MNTKNLLGGMSIDSRDGMLCIPPSIHPSIWLRWALALSLGLWIIVAQGEEFRYHYVSLDGIAPPPGFTFFSPAFSSGAINDSGLISGTVYNCDDVSCFDYHAAIYKDGTITVLQSGYGGPINASGSIGGSVDVDPVNFTTQAALFRKDKMKLIPPQPGEFTSFTSDLNDSGTALVLSYDVDFNETSVLYKKGQATVLDFGPTITSPASLSLNNRGMIAGTTGDAYDGARGFRFNPRTGEAMLLEPVPPDTLAWGMDINARGDVLGYSFVLDAPYHERIGVWDRNGNFKTYFDETISSNFLLFNDNNLIVITLIPSENNSYLVPKPGVRLNLADLVENLPTGQNLRWIYAINNHGDMLGFGSLGWFLLKRVDATDLATPTVAPPSSVVENEQHSLPPVAVDMLRRRMQPLPPLKFDSVADPLENLLLK